MTSSHLAPRIYAENLSFSYGGTEILRSADFSISGAQMIAIKGASGSGKSTLFYLLSGFLRPQAGSVSLLGKELSSLGEAEMALFRNQHLGFVFQQFFLLPHKSVLENVLLPTIYPAELKSLARQGEKRAKEILGELGLAKKYDALPSKLSGGEQQRVSIARALINSPSIIFADEPTGNLDELSTRKVLSIFRDLVGQGKMVIIITHEEDVARACDQVFVLKDKRPQ